ncbi:LON peptidase substrate-binding domain-containing protein [Bdellovibrio sp. HCB209]|uniref:LON peptidase substrate-binding domain-containing protein n=1 Tax=Bdellovibrio sp. HCB209 TaxID=3394354 RepID=UPI0039B629EE
MEVFLFPLVNVTLFPHTTKPLNIFEPRYLAMVKDAVAQQKPIALAYIEDPTKVAPVRPGDPIPFIRDVAGYGHVQIIEERVNGTLLVFLQGQGKLRIKHTIDRGTPYMVCEADIIPEQLIVEPSHLVRLQGLMKILTRWVHTHIPDPAQRDMFMRNLHHAPDIVGAFSSYMVRDYDLQQMVLEFNDINEKVDFLHRLTESNELTT